MGSFDMLSAIIISSFDSSICLLPEENLVSLKIITSFLTAILFSSGTLQRGYKYREIYSERKRRLPIFDSPIIIEFKAMLADIVMIRITKIHITTFSVIFRLLILR